MSAKRSSATAERSLLLKALFFVVLDRRHTFSVQFPSCSLPIFNKKKYGRAVCDIIGCVLIGTQKMLKGYQFSFFKKRPQYVSSHSLASLMLCTHPLVPPPLSVFMVLDSLHISVAIHCHQGGFAGCFKCRFFWLSGCKSRKRLLNKWLEF